MDVPAYNDLLPEGRTYFSIGEVAEMLQVSTSTIRSWEKRFPGIHPTRNKKGDRLYKLKEVRRFQSIHYLLKVKRFTIEGARSALQESGAIYEKMAEVRQRLLRVREDLTSIRDHMQDQQ